MKWQKRNNETEVSFTEILNNSANSEQNDKKLVHETGAQIG
jgi:hypothetical protein